MNCLIAKKNALKILADSLEVYTVKELVYRLDLVQHREELMPIT